MVTWLLFLSGSKWGDDQGLGKKIILILSCIFFFLALCFVSLFDFSHLVLLIFSFSILLLSFSVGHEIKCQIHC